MIEISPGQAKILNWFGFYLGRVTAAELWVCFKHLEPVLHQFV